MQTSVQNFHAVDDGGSLPFEVFLSFVEAFRFPLRLKSLSPQGKEARFFIIHNEQAQAYQNRATRVIKILRLPLEASLKISEIGGLVFESVLIIKFIDRC